MDTEVLRNSLLGQEFVHELVGADLSHSQHHLELAKDSICAVCPLCQAVVVRRGMR